jgi:hypothetical protein
MLTVRNTIDKIVIINRGYSRALELAEAMTKVGACHPSLFPFTIHAPLDNQSHGFVTSYMLVNLSQQ